MPHSLKDYDELHDGQGHLVRDSEEASRALEWVQQILEKDQDEHHGGVERKGDEDDEALPISDEAAAELRQLLEPLHPADVAWILEALPLDERLAVWNLVKSESDGDILVEVNDGVRETLIDAMDRDELVDAVETLDTDEIADLVDDLPPDVMAQVQEGLSHEERAQLRAAMSYPEESVGARMDFEIVSIREETTIELVLRYLRRFETLPDHTDQVFVVDRLGHLKGTLSLSQILTTDPAVPVKDLMHTDMLTLNPLEDSSDAAQAFERYDLVSAPVVDEAGRLVGRLTVNEIVDVIREESEEDAFAAVGLDDEQDIFASVWEAARSRWLWLGVNLCTAFFASRVISAFDGGKLGQPDAHAAGALPRHGAGDRGKQGGPHQEGGPGFHHQRHPLGGDRRPVRLGTLLGCTRGQDAGPRDVPRHAAQHHSGCRGRSGRAAHPPLLRP